MTGLSHKDRDSGTLRRVELDGIFVQIGLVPNTEWLKGALALSPRGEIEVDHRGQTSVPGVFAAGDATAVPYQQIVIAMGDGAKAALSAFEPDPPGAGGAGRRRLSASRLWRPATSHMVPVALAPPGSGLPGPGGAVLRSGPGACGLR